MVERIEGFCSEQEWRRAYREINEMEEQLVSFGNVLIKFWLHIDKDEQLARFQERELSLLSAGDLVNIERAATELGKTMGSSLPGQI